MTLTSKIILGALLGVQMTCIGGGAALADEPKDWQFTVGEPAQEARARWERLTQGEDLARGKAVAFSPVPSYELTHDDNDAYDLTDGKLSERLDDRIWFNKDAVGWAFNAGAESAGGVLMRVDLGSMQPVGQIAIRLLGGKEQGSLVLPNGIEFLVSIDGKSYYSLQRMQKLLPAERELSDFKRSFYVAEESVAFMHAFVCQEPVRARYIGIKIMPEADVYTDQISVLKAAPGVALSEVTDHPPVRVFTDGFVVMPKLDSFVVTSNIITPNWLLQFAYGDDNKPENKYSFRLRLPRGLRLLPESKPAFNEVEEDAAGRVYEFPEIKPVVAKAYNLGELYIECVAAEPLAKDARAVFTGFVNGKESHSLEYPVQVVEIPEVPEVIPQTFAIGMGWLGDSQAQGWPGYLQNARKMGFGMSPTFPMWWDIRDGKLMPSAEKHKAFLEETRKQGYRIVQEDSPFHQTGQAVKAALAAGLIDDAERMEIYNQVDGKPGEYISPLYRGKYYRQEVERVGLITSLTRPDQVHWDVEYWYYGMSETRQDPRFKAALEKSGKDEKDFVTDLGAEMLGDLAKAVRAAVPDQKIEIGLYHADPGNAVMDNVFAWDKIYPEVVDLAQPSLYVQGRALDVAKRIRMNYAATGKRNIVPWLTAGTYGEFEPRLMEPMVLEAILNGAGGITYFLYFDFDPMDFYYNSKALADLGRFPDLMKTGKPVEFSGDNAQLHYTAFSNGKESLLLVGNYNRSHETKATVPVGLPNVRSATIVGGANLTVRNSKISLDVPAGEFRLIHVKTGA